MIPDINLTPITLSNQQVALEPLQESHREILRDLSRDDRISFYSPALKSKFDSWFDKALTDAQQISYIVRLLSTQKVIGSTRLYSIHPEHRRLVIGYTWYIPEVWGSGINKECKALLLHYAFETLQMNRVEFHIDSRNTRSRAAVKKLGATEEGTLRQHIILDDGHVRDTVIYSLLKAEWAVSPSSNDA